MRTLLRNLEEAAIDRNLSAEDMIKDAIRDAVRGVQERIMDAAVIAIEAKVAKRVEVSLQKRAQAGKMGASDPLQSIAAERMSHVNGAPAGAVAIKVEGVDIDGHRAVVVWLLIDKHDAKVGRVQVRPVTSGDVLMDEEVPMRNITPGFFADVLESLILKG